MRPFLPGDVDCAVARLLTQPEQGWEAEARTMLDQADLADRYRKRLGRPHPRFGNGSLMAAARAGGAAPHPCRLTPRAVRATLVVLACIKSRQERRHGL